MKWDMTLVIVDLNFYDRVHVIFLFSVEYAEVIKPDGTKITYPVSSPFSVSLFSVCIFIQGRLMKLFHAVFQELAYRKEIVPVAEINKKVGIK